MGDISTCVIWQISWHNNLREHGFGVNISLIFHPKQLIMTLSFLRRDLTFAPESTKEVAYKTLVRHKL